MRFEIGIGGGIVIGVGLLALSGGVFCLGLIGGYEIASQDQHNREVAAVYPLPAPPLPQTLPTGGGSSSETLTSHAVGAAAPTSGASELGAPAAHADVPAAKPAVPPAAKRVAVAVPPAAPLGAAALPSGSAGASAAVRPARPEHKLAIREAPPGGAHSRQPYSVQIDAVMDRQGAENMARRLSAGGYEPYIVPTDIGGQTWYKVRVGHYETEEDAHAAEQRLKAQYEGSLPTH